MSGDIRLKLSSPGRLIARVLPTIVVTASEASQTEAVTGTITGKFMSPLRVQQKLDAQNAAHPLIVSTGGFQTGGAHPIATTFQGDQSAANVWFNISATPSQAARSEWIAQFYQTSSVGGGNPTTATKGAIYAHTIANSGSANVWAANLISQASSGLETGRYVTTLEIDQNNNNSDRPAASFEYGSDGTNGQYYGISLGHGGSFKSSAAIYITDLTGSGRWQRCIAIGASAGSRCVIEDQSTSTTGWLMTGTKTNGLDWGGATITNAFLLPNNANVLQKDTGGTARNLIRLTNTDTTNVGDGTHNVFVDSPNLAPLSSNVTSCGANGFEWSAVYTKIVATSAAVTKTGTSGSQGAADSALIINASGTYTLTLVSAATYPGRWLYIKTIANQTVNSASSNVIPLVGGSAGTALLTNTAGKWAILQSNGTNWEIMAAN